MTSLDDWSAARHGFWHNVGGPPEGATPQDALPDLDLLRNSELITLWIGSGLDDQLALPWLAWLLPLAGIERERLSVIEFPEDFRAGHRGAMLASFTPLELRHHPAPTLLDPEKIATLDSAWRALTAATPVALRGFIGASASADPLRAALSRLARWYPQADTGLARWDYSLLSNAGREGPRASHVVGHTLVARGLEPDHVGDLWLYWRLRRLAAMRHPLVTLEGHEAQWGGLVATLTRAGQEVLSRAVNAVQLNGIDDWVAGVHLDSTSGHVWYAQGDEILC